MDRTEVTEKNEVSTKEASALVAEILETIGRLSARKREEGKDAPGHLVTFDYTELRSVLKSRGLFKPPQARMEGFKEKKIAWLLGPLINQGTASVYIDAEGHGYFVTSFGKPRNESDVTRITDRLLASKTHDELIEIRTLLARSRT